MNKDASSSDASRSDSKTVQLKDGRRLGYVEYGDPGGKPCFHFHGWPSSRSEVHGDFGIHQAASRLYDTTLSLKTT